MSAALNSHHLNVCFRRLLVDNLVAWHLIVEAIMNVQ